MDDTELYLAALNPPRQELSVRSLGFDVAFAVPWQIVLCVRLYWRFNPAVALAILSISFSICLYFKHIQRVVGPALRPCRRLIVVSWCIFKGRQLTLFSHLNEVEQRNQEYVDLTVVRESFSNIGRTEMYLLFCLSFVWVQNDIFVVSTCSFAESR